MIYYTIHVDDSGAIENVDKKIIGGEQFLICKMYDDNEFNKLNDILHSLYDYILNEKASSIIRTSRTIPFELKPAKVLRKEKTFGFIKRYKSYHYFQLSFPDKNATDCYSWIDFNKSDIVAIDNWGKRIKIQSHQHKLELIEENKWDSEISCSFESKNIVFGENFDSDIDLFKIPHYSSGIYVSERLKNKLEEAKITGIGFAESREKLSKVWQPLYPRIEFSN